MSEGENEGESENTIVSKLKTVIHLCARTVMVKPTVMAYLGKCITLARSLLVSENKFNLFLTQN